MELKVVVGKYISTGMYPSMTQGPAEPDRKNGYKASGHSYPAAVPERTTSKPCSHHSPGQLHRDNHPANATPATR